MKQKLATFNKFTPLLLAVMFDYVRLVSERDSLKQKSLKSMADYHNLVKRQQKQQAQLAQVVSGDFIQSLIQPLEHLALASDHLNDHGLKMIVSEFWQALKERGVKEVNPLGEEFDENTMEAVENRGKGNRVKQVLSRGYLLNGKVIKHAKVAVG